MTQFQQLTDAESALVEAAQLRIAMQRIRLEKQVQHRKAEWQYGVTPRA